ncbi:MULTISPECIES: SDR family NAD(P)-dependent oxidoreductase [Niastella]|uniref:SDR family NAD(P)-dependent oxidoreductase n=1 Tax=Niastella soli TaxID=2821487 RepID=A0ABS3Z158_9BACT|nr:SDR family NAD(P)-dependent oxidoreductase [Niastella soli]MBO9203909.1 SDR family NAD(P)-dependent oxidoreductase [Niastella soli]
MICSILCGMKIIIIGATSGMGRELAQQYLALGHTVAITGRRAELLLELKTQFPALYTGCFDVQTDDAVDRLQLLITQMGGLDLLIYSAGYGDPSTELVPAIEIDSTATNVMGFVKIATYTFNYFLQQGHGQLAVISSVAALRGNSWTPAYSASKAYVSNYAEGLNIKARKLNTNIVITDIRPGFVKTKMAKGNGQFWVAPVEKAARQIRAAIDAKKRVAYVTKRWWLIAFIMKRLPYWLYNKIG